MLPLSTLRPLARPELIRASLGDARAGVALPLPSRRTWVAGLAVGLVCLVVASIAWQQLSAMRRLEAGTLVVLLRWCWVVVLWAGALGLFLLTLILLAFRESARLAGNRLIHVVRLAPLRLFLEYDLAKVRNLHAAGAGTEGARIRFDYGDRDVGLGSDMPLAEAEARVRMIQSAIDGLGARRPSQGGAPAPRPTPRP